MGWSSGFESEGLKSCRLADAERRPAPTFKPSTCQEIAASDRVAILLAMTVEMGGARFFCLCERSEAISCSVGGVGAGRSPPEGRSIANPRLILRAGSDGEGLKSCRLAGAERRPAPMFSPSTCQEIAASDRVAILLAMTVEMGGARFFCLCERSEAISCSVGGVGAGRSPPEGRSIANPRLKLGLGPSAKD